MEWALAPLSEGPWTLHLLAHVGVLLHLRGGAGTALPGVLGGDDMGELEHPS